MKVLQFAFDSREDSNYLPHTYTRNCVVYTGTHDNDTTKGWYHTAAGSTRQFAKEYMYKPRLDEDTLAGDFIAMAMGSAADLCIVPMQSPACENTVQDNRTGDRKNFTSDAEYLTFFFVFDGRGSY